MTIAFSNLPKFESWWPKYESDMNSSTSKKATPT